MKYLLILSLFFIGCRKEMPIEKEEEVLFIKWGDRAYNLTSGDCIINLEGTTGKYCICDDNKPFIIWDGPFKKGEEKIRMAVSYDNGFTWKYK
jgi:hypothetical protein